MSETPIFTWRLRVIGRVQGVGYRAWCIQTATNLGLTGWVRNVSDGSVEVMAQGQVSALTELATAAHGGPSGAEVSEVNREDVTTVSTSLPSGFHQLATQRL